MSSKRCLILVAGSPAAVAFDFIAPLPLSMNTLYRLSEFTHNITRFSIRQFPELKGNIGDFKGSLPYRNVEAGTPPFHDWGHKKQMLMGELEIRHPGPENAQELFNTTIRAVSNEELTVTGQTLAECVQHIAGETETFDKQKGAFERICLVGILHGESAFRGNLSTTEALVAELISAADNVERACKAEVSAGLGLAGLELLISRDILHEETKNERDITPFSYLADHRATKSLIVKSLKPMPHLHETAISHLNEAPDKDSRRPIAITPIVPCGLDHMEQLNWSSSTGTFIRSIALVPEMAVSAPDIVPVGIRELMISLITGETGSSQMKLDDYAKLAPVPLAHQSASTHP